MCHPHAISHALLKLYQKEKERRMKERKKGGEEIRRGKPGKIK